MENCKENRKLKFWLKREGKGGGSGRTKAGVGEPKTKTIEAITDAPTLNFH